MPRRPMRVTDKDEALLCGALQELRTRPDIPADFPAEAREEAARVARGPRMPAEDATDLPLFTIDPPGSTDLDQAMYLARRAPGGFRVYYAIADVAAFVTPGSALDNEAHRRVQTLYFPDERVPLHPPVLSEGAASLLPDQDRPAVLWRLDLDEYGALAATDVRRAVVRSRARLDYEGVQRAIESGTAEEPLSLLRDIGQLREERERARGGISLNVPEQEIVLRDGRYRLAYRAPLPADGWNAQLSLLTGMAAADLMLASGTGILRTLPSAPDGAVGRLRRTARALGVDWPHHTSYAELIRGLDPHRSTHAAFLQECTALLRGAGYTVFDGSPPDSAHALHSAVAAPYAHATAPLRRLVDRYAGELCLAAAAGQPVPEWVRAALPALPEEMAEGGRRANRVERECVDLVEAAVLHDRIGEHFDGYVVDVHEERPRQGTVHLCSPAVVGRLDAAPEAPPLPLGHPLRVRLTAAYPGREPVRFVPA
ncbi:RNB domain-containing ribonuclease [Streptomyces purpurogeneiscleroticus]|uniref:RNB domain-containing ribonuclease n=1 Tax=Streptomyces purpurogeneiscleroticus TaxID=68259 RepID=UPI001CBB08F6|nr:RNB domain-containing ribonuclease [Streptomyces purpurogeneiscleroticus]MBZ4020023.1 ribonuclease II [Streptomyces purpurogeneiscleroticus]